MGDDRLGAHRRGPEALDTLVAAQRQKYVSELAGLTRLRRSRLDDPLVALLIDAAIAHTKADLEIVDSAAERLAPVAERAARGLREGGHETQGDVREAGA
ncbi:hypothetical protein [Streptomyces sp. NPDC054834]